MLPSFAPGIIPSFMTSSTVRRLTTHPILQHISRLSASGPSLTAAPRVAAVAALVIMNTLPTIPEGLVVPPEKHQQTEQPDTGQHDRGRAPSNEVNLEHEGIEVQETTDDTKTKTLPVTVPLSDKDSALNQLLMERPKTSGSEIEFCWSVPVPVPEVFVSKSRAVKHGGYHDCVSNAKAKPSNKTGERHPMECSSK